VSGRRIGSIREKCPYVTYAEPAKYAKHAKYAKYVPRAPYARPALSTCCSDELFEAHLRRGAVGGVWPPNKRLQLTH